jgi:protein-S-isoprenylcysteine O-methyltransferase Ste14
MTDSTSDKNEPILKRFVPFAGVLALCTWAAFELIRRSEWTYGVTYWALMAAAVLINSLCVLFWNPVLIKRRMGVRSDTKTWDKVWLAALIASFIAIGVVAYQDLAARGPEPVSVGVTWGMGLVLFVAGWAMGTWPMTVNPFFEKTVRIQTEHDHHVIDTGPYAYVRHPGYVGFNAILIATPFLLNSLVTAIPCAVGIATFVVRTALEDRTLQAELPGYREYAQRVRYRLVPFLW